MSGSVPLKDRDGIGLVTTPAWRNNTVVAGFCCVTNKFTVSRYGVCVCVCYVIVFNIRQEEGKEAK